MSLESLIKKRTDLQSALEQFIDQINRTNGAIAVLDDLIMEAKAEEDTKRESDAATVDDTPAEALALAAPEAPEMLPVTHDAESDGYEEEQVRA